MTTGEDGLSVFPGTRIWFDEIERRVNDIRHDLDYLMHPETGIHARLASVQSNLKAWAIGILVALMMNLVGVILLLTTQK